MPEEKIAQAVQLLDLMLEHFADDSHWTRGHYDDGNGGHCLVGALLHLSRKHRLPRTPAIALLQDAMPRPGLPLVYFNDTCCGSVGVRFDDARGRDRRVSRFWKSRGACRRSDKPGWLPPHWPLPCREWHARLLGGRARGRLGIARAQHSRTASSQAVPETAAPIADRLRPPCRRRHGRSMGHGEVRCREPTSRHHGFGFQTLCHG
jgi:hypothetical protein